MGRTRGFKPLKFLVPQTSALDHFATSATLEQAPGIEPGPGGWHPPIITTRPCSRLVIIKFLTFSIQICCFLVSSAYSLVVEIIFL